jgi:hypothetical protein
MPKVRPQSKQRLRANRDHAAQLKARWRDPKFRAQMLAARKHAWTPTRRRQHARIIKRKWRDPQYATAASAGVRRPKTEAHKQHIGDARRRTLETVVASISRANRNLVVRSSAYCGRDHPLRLHCNKCGTDWRESWLLMREHLGNCPTCRPLAKLAWTKAKRKQQSETLRNPLDRVIRRIRRANLKMTVVRGTYQSGRGWRLRLRCKTCHTEQTVWEREHYSSLGRCKSCQPHRCGVSEQKARRTLERLTGWKFPKSRPDWLKGHSSHPLELDGYNRRHGIAFEYQGYQHYEPVKQYGGRQGWEALKLRDKRKRMACLRHGVLLICVPYWKRDIESFLRRKLAGLSLSS